MSTAHSAAFSAVLIANRGEIAVRIARACADAGMTSIAVYAEPDADAVHVRAADQAFALGGSTAAESYLDIDKLLDVARRSGADAVHPGYGFLAENAEFARRVVKAGLVWIGPPADAIEALGDKVSARHLAAKVGAPLVAGTTDPVANADEVVAFARAHGLPVAIKAAFGGGGRGLKVAWSIDEIPALFESATREAVAAFGRGECFVERYLDRPRHVETQCLADVHGHVVVVSTRDCSLQRRHQKLVEEAPAPFLTTTQRDQLYTASKAILVEAGYVGAGTCEFLVAADGTISFLEVNTRLQVEHPVSEEVSGIDLVREQFRLAAGEPLGYDDPPVRGHSIEFRINGEDPGRGFLPQPGPVRVWQPPSGPGVRVDSGVESGSAVSGAFDSMLAKIIVTGADRAQAMERARRALAECRVEGLPTTLTFHRVVLDDPAFAPASPADAFSVHTRWIETDFANSIAPWQPTEADSPAETAERRHVVVEVDGRRLDVVLPAEMFGAPDHGGETARRGPRRPRRPRAATAAAAADTTALVSPMQATVVKLVVADGDTVAQGDLVAVLEAMKMEQPLLAHRDGTVAGLVAAVGDTVSAGAVLCQIS